MQASCDLNATHLFSASLMLAPTTARFWSSSSFCSRALDKNDSHSFTCTWMGVTFLWDSAVAQNLEFELTVDGDLAKHRATLDVADPRARSISDEPRLAATGDCWALENVMQCKNNNNTRTNSGLDPIIPGVVPHFGFPLMDADPCRVPQRIGGSSPVGLNKCGFAPYDILSIFWAPPSIMSRTMATSKMKETSIEKKEEQKKQKNKKWDKQYSRVSVGQFSQKHGIGPIWVLVPRRPRGGFRVVQRGLRRFRWVSRSSQGLKWFGDVPSGSKGFRGVQRCSEAFRGFQRCS